VIKFSEELQVVHAEASAVPGGQILGQSVKELSSVLGSDLASLLKLNNLSANVPVGGGDDDVYGPCGSPLGCIDQITDATEQSVIAGGRRAESLNLGFLFAHGQGRYFVEEFSTFILRMPVPIVASRVP